MFSKNENFWVKMAYRYAEGCRFKTQIFFFIIILISILILISNRQSPFGQMWIGVKYTVFIIIIILYIYIIYTRVERYKSAWREIRKCLTTGFQSLPSVCRFVACIRDILGKYLWNLLIVFALSVLAVLTLIVLYCCMMHGLWFLWSAVTSSGVSGLLFPGSGASVTFVYHCRKVHSISGLIY